MLGNRGVGKGGSSSEVEGFYRSLRGAIAHPPISSAPPPHKKACHSPSATVSHLPPQEPTSITPEASESAAQVTEQASEAASPAAPPAPEEALLTNMQPLHIQLGHVKRVYRCQVEGCKEEPSTSHATIVCMYAKCTWGLGWCVLPVENHLSTWTHFNATKKSF